MFLIAGTSFIAQFTAESNSKANYAFIITKKKNSWPVINVSKLT